MSLFDLAMRSAVTWLVPAVLAVLAAWAALKRKRIKAWRAERKDRMTKFDALLETAPEMRAGIADSKDSIGRLTGQLRLMDTRLTAQDKMLGTLQARSQSDFESSPVAKFECDSTGRNETVNNAYAQLLGVEKEDLLGFRWRSHIPVEALPSYLARFKSAADDHRKFDDQLDMRRSDGTLVRVHVHMLPFPPDMGPATHWVGLLTVISA